MQRRTMATFARVWQGDDAAAVELGCSPVLNKPMANWGSRAAERGLAGHPLPGAAAGRAAAPAGYP